jgi:serine/threonine protein kinase
MRYNFEKTLGEGAFGKVKVASLVDDPKKKFAIKSIPRRLIDLRSKENSSGEEMDEEQMQKYLELEILIVFEMDHPNIIKFHQCVYDNVYLNIVMELVQGTTLADYLETFPHFKVPEDKCQIILRQVLNAIKYFHSRGIVHRDLKLGNILLQGAESGRNEDLIVKLIDFGMSKFTKKGNKKINLSTYCGTIDFIAPEVFQGTGYDDKCDMWSIGVIAFFMLSGSPPFMGKNDLHIQKKIITCDYDFDGPGWEGVSD